MTVAETLKVRDRLDVTASSLLVALCLAWGLNHVAVKVVNAGLQPVFQAGLRSVLATLLVVLWCAARGIPLLQRDGTLVAGVAVGLLFGVEFILIYVGLDYTTVSRGIVFVYLMPIFVALGAHFLLPAERLTPLQTAGLIASFIGVVVAFSDRFSLPSPEALIGDVLCVIAAAMWAATTLIIKTTSLRRASAEKVLAYQLASSAVLMMIVAPAFGPFIRDITPLILGAFAYQVVIVVSVTYLVWFWLVHHYPAAKLSSFTFLTPIFGVLLGHMLLDEPVTWRLVAALAFVAAGIYLVNRPRRLAECATQG